MTAPLDIDQLRTFIAIAETGSFTRAAEVVHKTQSAVSMQMKRLEERVDRPIFARDGRASKLTEDGERLLDYARRIVRLNAEALAAFSDSELSGCVRLGVPDDYADRYLPEIMARFSRVYPGAELTIFCEPSLDLMARLDENEIDLAIVTSCESYRASEIFRQERLMWVTSNRHSAQLEVPLPLALGRPTCDWRKVAMDSLDSVGRAHRLLFSSGNAGAISAAVLAGLAVSVLPTSGLRPGMRVLTPAEGFAELPRRIGLLRNLHNPSPLAEALAGHIVSSLDNLSQASARRRNERIAARGKQKRSGRTRPSGRALAAASKLTEDGERLDHAPAGSLAGSAGQGSLCFSASRQLTPGFPLTSPRSP